MLLAGLIASLTWLLSAEPVVQDLPPFRERFLTSAGFGGLMAVVAATIAATIAYIQFRQSKRQAADDRWWETLTWVYDRSIVATDTVPPLPQTVTFSMLSALHEEAAPRKQGRLRGETITAILNMFEGAATPMPEASGNSRQHPSAGTGNDVEQDRALIPVAAPEAARLLEILRSDLADEGYGKPFALLAAAHDYEAAARSSVERLVAQTADATVSTQAGTGDVGFDLLVRVKDAVILIDFKYARKTIIPSLAAEWAHRLRRTGPFPKGDARGGALIVANQPVTRNASQKLDEVGGGKVLHVLWRGEEDDLALMTALGRLGLVQRADGAGAQEGQCGQSRG